MRTQKFWIFIFILFVYTRISRSLFERTIKKILGKSDHYSRSVPRSIPKIIWIYWKQGDENAPEIVRHCIASWRNKNPTWDIRVLNVETAADIVDLPHSAESLSIQSYADLLRLKLLCEYGGVWADATTYCLYPLDCWLPPLAQRGFFAFSWTPNDRWFIWPGVRRSLTNWFLASEPKGRIISRWEEASLSYWEGRTKPHNYYWPHIMVDYLHLISYPFRQALDDFPKIGCYSAHLVHDCVVHGRDIDQVLSILETNSAPVQKLRWDWDSKQVESAKKILGIHKYDDVEAFRN